MATVKIKFHPTACGNLKGTLYYQISHKFHRRQVCTGYCLKKEEWEILSPKIIHGVQDASRLRHQTAAEQKISSDLRRLFTIIRRLERSGTAFTVNDIVTKFHATGHNTHGLRTFGQAIITQLRQAGKLRTAETYESSLNSFTRFLGERNDVALDNIDTALIEEYEAFLKSTGLSLNSVSFYMRNLRAIYNRGVERNLTKQRYPFKHVYTGVEKTVKRAVPPVIIRRLRHLDLSSTPQAELARDLFLFSFYTRGMAFVDMAFLKKTDLRNGVLTYRRHKTRQQLLVTWERPMQAIVEHHAATDSPYLLPIIRQPGHDERRQYLNASHLLNRELKRIGEKIGCPIPLTFYCARHGWASIAQSKNVALSVISEAMGHDSEATTRIYLTSIDTAAVDSANRLVINTVL